MHNPIIVALDFPTLPQAIDMAKILGKNYSYKVGKALNVVAGTPTILKYVGAKETFLDLKFHDIPNTVADAVRGAAQQQVWMLNLHISGGMKMMQAAVKARNEVFISSQGLHRTELIGVTVLTSLDAEALKEMGIYQEKMTVEEIVAQLARAAYDAGLDGVNCSPHEIAIVRQTIPDNDFLVVTPGIRGKDDPTDDHKRTMTARQAIDRGASYLVIGHPITKATNPARAAEKLFSEIGN